MEVNRDIGNVGRKVKEGFGQLIATGTLSLPFHETSASIAARRGDCVLLVEMGAAALQELEQP